MTPEEIRVSLAERDGWRVTVWDVYAFQILHADGRGCGGPGNSAGVVMDKAGVPDYLNSDTEMLNWLETNKAKVEPPFGNSDWIGIFWGQRDSGGHSIRDAIRTAMTENLHLSPKQSL